MIRHRVIHSVVLTFVLFPSVRLWAQPPERPAVSARDLKRLSIEELAELPVTTMARRPEPLSEVAAAVSVIRSAELRRAGVTSLAEALRLADSVHVAQVYGPGWAITARGFNISTANKLLVLIDGRTVYSPLFAGVFWDVQDLVLADIDRIEVTRGPGGTLWGANAVNGIVNIVTKAAADTQGPYVTVTAGNEARLITTGRYGGTIGTKTYRAYAKLRSIDQHVFVTGAPGQDDVQFGQSGFRIDSAAGGASTWLFQGDAYYGTEGLWDRPDTRGSGGNLLGRWTRRQSPTAEFQARAYYDETNPPRSTPVSSVTSYDRYRYPTAGKAGNSATMGVRRRLPRFAGRRSRRRTGVFLRPASPDLHAVERFCSRRHPTRAESPGGGGRFEN